MKQAKTNARHQRNRTDKNRGRCSLCYARRGSTEPCWMLEVSRARTEENGWGLKPGGVRQVTGHKKKGRGGRMFTLDFGVGGAGGTGCGRPGGTLLELQTSTEKGEPLQGARHWLSLAFTGCPWLLVPGAPLGPAAKPLERATICARCPRQPQQLPPPIHYKRRHWRNKLSCLQRNRCKRVCRRIQMTPASTSSPETADGNGFESL